jgi:hypothetical protein
MKKITLMVLMMSFVLTASIALADYGEDNSLSGYVKEYKTKDAIGGAKVKLYKKSGKLKDTDKTNAKGKYKFSDLTEGPYKVKVKVSGYRNPKDANKDSVSKTVKVDGDDKQNLYLEKI